jgi:hypothetical protein
MRQSLGFEKRRDMIKKLGIKLVAGLVTLFFQIGGFCATTNQSVVPVGLENVEGSTRDSFFKQGSPAERNVLISTAALPPSWTTALLITGISFRVDQQPFATAFDAVVPRIEMRFSTSSKTVDTMGATYAQNAGPDSVLVFAHDSFRLFSGGGAGPNPFGLEFKLDQPFHYDPAQGNLLYNLKTFGSSFAGGTDIDAQGSPLQIYGTTVPGVTSSPITQMPVTQFFWTTIPEPEPLWLSPFGLVPLYFMVRRRT